MDRRGRKPTDADYGLGEHTIDGDELGLVDEQELTDRLIRTFESADYRPPRLPAVAMELMALSQQPDVEFDAIESLLEQDAMLAGEVLSLARSAFYRGIRQVDGLREALVRLGLSKLREVVMQAAMNVRVFRSAAYRSVMERLRQHCRATAHLSCIVSQYTPMPGEQAFLCGLLHDVGIAGTLLVLGDVERGKEPPDLAALWPAIDAVHARAGARMVELWGLPPEFAMAVGAHHQVTVEGYEHPFAATVCLAEWLAAESDLGLASTGGAWGDEGQQDVASLLIHDGIDRSDAMVVNRASAALALTEQVVELIRSAGREWAEKHVNEADAVHAGSS